MCPVCGETKNIFPLDTPAWYECRDCNSTFGSPARMHCNQTCIACGSDDVSTVDGKNYCRSCSSIYNLPSAPIEFLDNPFRKLLNDIENWRNEGCSAKEIRKKVEETKWRTGKRFFDEKTINAAIKVIDNYRLRTAKAAKSKAKDPDKQEIVKAKEKGAELRLVAKAIEVAVIEEDELEQITRENDIREALIELEEMLKPSIIQRARNILRRR